MRPARVAFPLISFLRTRICCIHPHELALRLHELVRNGRVHARASPYPVAGWRACRRRCSDDGWSQRDVEMIVFHEDEYLKLCAPRHAAGRNGDRLMLSFTGIGHAMGGIEIQKPEFFRTCTTRADVLFVIDKTRSWGNRLDFKIISDIVKERFANRRICTIGNSMGGYLAIVASAFIDTDVCLAFAPQYSVDPAEVPWERRWRKYRDQIPDFRLKNANAYFRPGTRYYVFSSGQRPDIRHARQFARRTNIFHYVFRRTGHEVALALKETGRLGRLVSECLEKHDDPTVPLPCKRISP